MKNALSVLLFVEITAVALTAQTNKILAQKVVEEIKAAHPEITEVELSATRPGKGCQTVAATEAKDIGEKCDQDEFTVMKTNRPFIEQEKTEFDVTLPIHDLAGKIIAVAGLDYKRESGRTKDTVAIEAMKVGAEIERRVTSVDTLFQPAR